MGQGAGAVGDGFDGGDFERAVAHVSADPFPRALVERLGIDWEHLSRLAVDAAASVLLEQGERRGDVVSHTGEAFTAGFLIGVHLGGEPPERSGGLPAAVDHVQARGRHAVIADQCDLASVARLETVYAEALVESMALARGGREALLSPVTRIFETGLAVGLELRSGGDESRPGTEQP